MDMPAATLADDACHRLRGRLLARIHRRYETVTVAATIGPLSFPFTRIADPDRVLDEVAAEADRREKLTGRREPDEHLHLPYWAELWDSAAGIGEFLTKLDAENQDAGEQDAETRGHGGNEDAETRRRGDAGKSKAGEVPPPRVVSASPRLRVPASSSLLASSSNVLDLGCGMGLSGTVAAALGARVMFADLEPSALLFARLNSLAWRDRVRTRQMNWRTDRLNERFELILGADILYERAQWEWLEPFWRGHLAKGGTVLLGEPGRQTGDLFVDWIVARGWVLERFEQNIATRARPVRIFRLHPRI